LEKAITLKKSNKHKSGVKPPLRAATTLVRERKGKEVTLGRQTVVPRKWQGIRRRGPEVGTTTTGGASGENRKETIKKRASGAGEDARSGNKQSDEIQTRGTMKEEIDITRKGWPKSCEENHSGPGKKPRK